MAGFWFWILVIVGSLIVGAILMMFFFFIITFFKDSKVKRKIPRDKKKLGEYIENNPDKFNGTNPGKVKMEDKETELENERRTQRKFREFEKLRREDIKQRTGGIETGITKERLLNLDVPRPRVLPESKELQNEFSKRAGSTKRKIKFD